MNKVMTNEEWNLYINKFGDLIYKIAYIAHGDPAITCFDSNKQDLYYFSLKAVNGYYSKNNLDPKIPLQTVIEDEMFSKYIKTCLWNRSNTNCIRGARYATLFRRIDEEEVAPEVANISAKPTSINSLEDKYNPSSDEVKQFISLILQDKECFTVSNKLAVNYIARKLNTTVYEVTKLAKKAAIFIEHEL